MFAKAASTKAWFLFPEAREEYEQYAKPVGVTHPTPAKRAEEALQSSHHPSQQRLNVKFRPTFPMKQKQPADRPKAGLKGSAEPYRGVTNHCSSNGVRGTSAVACMQTFIPEHQ